ncbi:MAG TPA: retropepsin-like aspartic protease [Pirellulaceae bacterium]|jgi:aspartyl protease family protein
MSLRFDPTKGLIVVRTALTGPRGTWFARLAFDTGATTTLVNRDVLIGLGYDLVTAIDQVQVTTGSRVEFAPKVTVQRFEALGIRRESFPLLAHTLPPSAGIDGVIGLDLVRGFKVVIDFRSGSLSIE